MIHQTAKTQREKDGETGNEFTVPQCCYGPGLSDGKVSPQGGSVRAGVRLCGVGRVMVSDRCWFSFRVRSRSRVCFARISNCMCVRV